jgi:translation initiation factor IF-2
MAKKDIFDRLARPASDGRRRADDPAQATRTRGETVTTRVTPSVVRRRRQGEDEVAEEAPAVVRRRVAVVDEDARSVEPPKEPAKGPPVVRPERTPEPVVQQAAASAAEPEVRRPREVAAEPEPAPRVAAPAVEVASAPKPAVAEPAPVVIAATVEAPSAKEAPAAPEAERAPPRVAREVVAEPVVAASAGVASPAVVPAAPGPVVAPAAPAAPGTGRDAPTRFRGLGSAVVVPPPGYDPTNPEAYRAQQNRSGPPGRDRIGGPPSGRRAAAPPYSPEPSGGGPRGGGGGGQPNQGGPGAAEDPNGGGRTRRRVAASPAAPAPVAPAPSSDDRGPRRRRRAGGRRDGERDAVDVRPRRRGKKGGPKTTSPQPKAQKRKIRVDGAISVGQLAHELSTKAAVVIKQLMEMGTLATVNEMLDAETASVLASVFDYEVENVGFNEEEYLQHIVVAEDEEEGDEPRPPVVTIMGHVDHGKTTLLDTIRRSRVAAGEAGGITQHIGAYQVEWKGHQITFLDTPGHAAFSAMRARGAGVTDIVVLVVAADDGVQPQTIEAINHAKAAGVPIVVAVNKIDKAGVNPDAIRQRLGEFGLVPEEWGGETMFANVSALKNQGIDELLETIMLQAEVLELAANSDRHAEGTVIEAKIERGRGPVASVIVQSGTLNLGDFVVIGAEYGKVRAMMDHRGKPIKTAGPSTPVELFGLSGLPNVGDPLAVVSSEKNARTLAEHRGQTEREAALKNTRRHTLDDLRRIAGEEERKTVFLVLKADVQGSLEALKSAISAIVVEGCDVRVLHDGVGNITESDVSLVAANDGLLIGFNVKVDPRARRAADDAGVEPELHTVIYSVLDRVLGALKGMLDPVYSEEHQGSAEVRAVFNISKIGTVAGCYVLDGKVGRSHGARLYRDGKEIWKGDVKTLKRFKDDVREVAAGYECGIALDGFDEVQVGDVIQTFAMVRVEPT